MKKLLLLCLSLITIGIILYSFPSKSDEITNKIERKTFKIAHDDDGKSPEARARFTEQRLLYEYYRQVNPLTGEIPKEEKLLEFDRSKKSKLKTNSSSRTIETTFINRGPTNFGGRTRALVIDRSDNTGNTIIAGGVSSGVFRTTDGGASWTKVSSNDEIHNVTAIVQDPRSGFESTWYYGTGESIGNSASLSGSSYLGQGIWKSTNGGVTWTQMPSTASSQTSYDSYFDFIFKLAVHPITGDLYAAVAGALLRYDGSWHIEKENGSITPSKHTDVVIASDGRVYASFSGKCDSSIEGVWTKNPSTGIWSRINTTPGPDFTPENNPSDNKENGVGRVVLALAPSNENKLYILFDTGLVSDCDAPLIEAELWMWDQSITTFTDYSSKLPDETGCSEGNDPFAIQGGYDLVVSVKPDNENFVVIGGTNAYKIGNITTDSSFLRIGGYRTSTSYFPYGYDTDPGDEHHPDIHAMVFNPFNNSVLFTGTDGGVHKTTNVIAGVVSWTSLNNNYQTLQYYHVAIDPLAGEDRFIGGTQDNGTTAGGTDFGMPDTVTQTKIWLGDGVSVGISRDDACVPFFYGYQSGYIRRDCPTPGVEITPDGSESEFVTLFHLDQSNNNALYYAGKGVLYRTNDATNVTTLTWNNLGALPGFGTTDLDEWFQTFSTSWGTYNASTSYLLMGGDSGHIYRLDDPQNVASVSSAVNITPPTATLGFPSIVTGLAIHPTNDNMILATYSNYGTDSIFLTEDKGATWTLVERNLSSHSIRSAAIAEDNGETTFFVGTARGLYSSSNPATTDWVREAPNQIGFALVSDLKYRPDDHKLLIGTHGNGMYEATISSTLGVDDFNNISSLMKLYPNPVQNDLNVKLSQADATQISYTISNLSGQTISQGVLDNEKIDVSQLTTGMYFLQLKSNDGRKGAKSFIKK